MLEPGEIYGSHEEIPDEVLFMSDIDSAKNISITIVNKIRELGNQASILPFDLTEVMQAAEFLEQLLHHIAHQDVRQVSLRS